MYSLARKPAPDAEIKSPLTSEQLAESFSHNRPPASRFVSFIYLGVYFHGKYGNMYSVDFMVWEFENGAWAKKWKRFGGTTVGFMMSAWCFEHFCLRQTSLF